MKMFGGGVTDVGRKRGHNEDYLLVDHDLGLYMVCDGMGGHAGGEVASETAARAVQRHLREHKDVLDAVDDQNATRDKVLRVIDDAIQLACREVYQLATSDQGKAGMGTTLTMLVLRQGLGAMGHVGDTRLYMRRGGRIHQLSEDHTYVNEMVRRGMATVEEAKKGPYGNVITRAVGIQAHVRADTLLFDVLAGDTLLLCSDGLSKHVDDLAELGRYLDNDAVDPIARQLVDVANARGGTDNITALVLRAEPEETDQGLDRNRTTEINLRIDTLKYIALFRHLDMGELCKVLNVVRAQQVEKGEIVVKEGEPGDALYAILEGKLMVIRNGHPVRELVSGSHFGEMALFNNRSRSATVQASESSRLLVMDRPRFNELVRKEPQLSVKLLWSFAQVLSLRLDEMSDLLYKTVNVAQTDVDVASPFTIPPRSEG